MILILLLVFRTIVPAEKGVGGFSDSGFASLAASFYDDHVLELEVYAAGVRDLTKTLELGAIGGLHYKVFRKLGLEPKFAGAIPAELRPKTKTQLLGA